MQYILIFLQILLFRAEISLNRFNTGLNISAIYQLPNSTLVLGTNEGILMVYNANGSFINKLEGPHRNSINSIVSFQANQTQFIAASDQYGLVSIWQINGKLNQLINKQERITEIKVEKRSQNAVLAISTIWSVYIHQIPSLKMVRWVEVSQHSIHKTLAEDFKLYILMRTPFNNTMYVYDIEKNTLNLIMSRQSCFISDFSVSQSSNGIHLFLISEFHNLEMYHLDNSYQVIDYVNKSANNPSASLYLSIISFNNDGNLPLFVARTASNQLQFYNGFDVTLFLQLNSRVNIMNSNHNRRLLLAGENGQVTSMNIVGRAKVQGIDIWIIFLILSLLAIGLYLCCGDCCPGVIQKWKRQKERNEIELELYRQRTELQNF